MFFYVILKLPFDMDLYVCVVIVAISRISLSCSTGVLSPSIGTDLLFAITYRPALGPIHSHI